MIQRLPGQKAVSPPICQAALPALHSPDRPGAAGRCAGRKRKTAFWSPAGMAFGFCKRPHVLLPSRSAAMIWAFGRLARYQKDGAAQEGFPKK
jgi:hypothetical protein